MNELLNKIIDIPINSLVLNYLKIDFSDDLLYFKNWGKARTEFDEGGIALFDEFGINIPIEYKYSISIYNIMVDPNTGEIFAFHRGRYSLFLKCDFEYFGITNSDAYRKGYTFDCITDITELGKEWAFMDKFEDSESEKLERTYELIKKRNANNV
ncbi:hypothetical protein [Aquimarina sp. Aq107]|uniref:hypothetical protein n=1 Tax=Aquimarina sp. Aq107 TaxID=1191912 RepID=UPI000D558A8F|nr:hypothetical protein [Aquimarina sp. Aq107]